jgi:carboxypeptidase family protein
MTSTTRCFATTLLILAVASPAFAQLPTGTILGTVRDASGGVIPGATLTATNSDTGLMRTAISSEDGSYRLAALPVGRYELRASLDGFRAAVREGITLAVTQEAVVNFTLEVGSLAETVAVTAEAPLVNTTSGSLGALVDAQAVAELPLNGRNYIELTFLQVGISKQENMTSGGTFVGSWYSSNGAPLRSNSYMLDGAVMANVLGGSAASLASTTLGVEGIQEWRVITNTPSAEYGLTMGSQMTVVTKSGTNAFHGSLFEYVRNSAFDARNYFDYRTAVTDYRLPPFKRNNYGGSIGGPVRRDRLFFFVTYEGLKERLGITNVANSIPAACRQEPLPLDGTCRFDGERQIAPLVKPLVALFPTPNLPDNRVTFPFTQPTDENFYQGRLDWTVSNADTAFGRLTKDDTTQLRPLAFPGFITDRHSRNQYLTLSETHVFAPNLLNTVRVSYSSTRLNVTSPTDIRGPEYDFVPGKGLGVINIAGIGEFGPRPSAPLRQNQDVLTWSSDAVYSRGAHALKFGALINRYEPEFTQGAGSTGQIIFPTVTHFLRGTPSAYTARAAGSILDSNWRFHSMGFYLQSDSRIRRVTLNLGLRYEFITDPEELNGRISTIRDIRTDANPTCADPQYCLQNDDVGKVFNNPSYKNFSPRVGFAWDVTGDGRTAVRGGAAVLYDIATFGSAIIGLNWPYSSTVRSSGNFQIPLVFPTGPGGRTASGVDFNLEQPHSVQTNLSIERELPWSMAATVSYAGTRGMNLYRRAEGNPMVPLGTPSVDARGNRVCANLGSAPDPASPEKCWLGTERRINPNWAQGNFLFADSNSWYHGLQVQVRKRLSQGLQFQSSYTYSKSTDEGQGIVDAENTTSHPYGSDPFNREWDRGPSSFDVRHNWSVNTIYRLPEPAGSSALNGFFSGWWLGGILRMRSGYPFTPVLGANRSRSLVNGGPNGLDRPDFAPGVNASDVTKGVSRGCDHIPAGTPVGTPDLWFDPCAFALPPEGFLGTAGRNSLRGPGLINLDMSLAKDTRWAMLGPDGRVEFRVEVFNVLNRANFATPEVGVADTPSAAVIFPGSPDERDAAGNIIPQRRLPTVGKILKTATPSRQVQFSLKLLF